MSSKFEGEQRENWHLGVGCDFEFGDLLLFLLLGLLCSPRLALLSLLLIFRLLLPVVILYCLTWAASGLSVAGLYRGYLGDAQGLLGSTPMFP